MLHFSDAEYARRMQALRAGMERRGLDAMLLFAPESQYWLTGFDTAGYVFFQCLIVSREAPVLLTRSADLRQAALTSTIRDVRIWKDEEGAQPAQELAAILAERDLLDKRIGIETETYGLSHNRGMRVRAALAGAELVEASDLVPDLRLTKSVEEIACVRRAAALCDDGWEAAFEQIRPGVSEGRVLAALQGAIFEGGGDYPACDHVIGSGEHALLCRYATGRRDIGETDQLTLEWAAAWRHYHVAAMRTVVIGTPRPAHAPMFEAAAEALLACERALVPGATMGDVFTAHADTLDARGLGAHRLNACGYALGARFSPNWMEPQMFHENAPTVIAPGQVHFLHMILMDSDSGTAMCLGRTSLVTESGSESLSRLPIEMPCR